MVGVNDESICVGFITHFLSTGQVSAIGEVVVLPLVVVVSFMGQPRLMFSMAEVGGSERTILY